MNAATDDDRADLLLVRDGDDRALGRLIARWERPLFAFAWRYVQNTADACDLVAQLFVRLHRQRAVLRADSNLRAWLFTALSNLCHNHHRWRRRHPTVSLELAGGAAAAPALSPDAALERGEAFAAVAAAIDALPHDLKVAVLLRYYQDLSLREIGAVIGCSERGVETRLHRGREKLRRKLTPRHQAQ